LACAACYFQLDVPVRNDAYPSTPYDPATDPLLAMDVQAFLDALEESVLTPMLETRDLFDRYTTVTRLYTTLSAMEMTADPVFAFNPDLDPVSNVHTGERLLRCDGTQQITLPQGIVLDTDGFTWPVTIEDELPMNLRILQLSTSGSGDVMLDNTDRVSDSLLELGIGSLGDLDADNTPPDDEAPGDDVLDGDAGDDGNDDDAGDDDDPPAVADSTREDGCGCRVVASPATSRNRLLALGSLLLLGFAGRRLGRMRATLPS
jgi:hypothetical protein